MQGTIETDITPGGTRRAWYGGQGYLFLPSNLHTILIALFPSSAFGIWASVLESDAEGIRFASVLDHVNVNTAGDLDYEKLPSLEGVALANEVQNWDTANFVNKRLQTKITFNDGTCQRCQLCACVYARH